MPKNLKLNGLEVCTSSLTQRPFRAAPCELLLLVTPSNQDESLAAFKKTGELGAYSGLRVSGVDDLSFLKDLPRLLYLEVVGERFNTRNLDSLTNLRGLQVESPGAGIDFACFPELEVFRGDWHRDNRNLPACRELRRLHLWHFQPRSSDFTELAGLIRLEQLMAIQTNIMSLTGLELLEDLRYLDISLAPQLRSLDALAWGESGIRELSISKAKNIESYRPISKVPHLRRLKLSGCGPMPDVKWTDGMNDLDFFSFVETNVLDGDLAPLLKLPKLRYVGTMDKKHYNYKCDVLNELLEARGQKP